MSGEAIVTPIKIPVEVEGIDRSIHSTQRLLYSVNALRLGIEDIQRLGKDPSLQNLMWTGIQLTRVWNHLYALVTATNKAQRVGIAQGTLRGGVGGRAMGVMGVNTAMRSLFGEIPSLAVQPSALSSLFTALGIAGLSPLALGALGLGAAAILTVSALGYNRYFADRRFRIEREEFIKHQREIAKSQGYDY